MVAIATIATHRVAGQPPGGPPERREHADQQRGEQRPAGEHQDPGDRGGRQHRDQPQPPGEQSCRRHRAAQVHRQEQGGRQRDQQRRAEQPGGRAGQQQHAGAGNAQLQPTTGRTRRPHRPGTDSTDRARPVLSGNGLCGPALGAQVGGERGGAGQVGVRGGQGERDGGHRGDDRARRTHRDAQ